MPDEHPNATSRGFGSRWALAQSPAQPPAQADAQPGTPATECLASLLSFPLPAAALLAARGIAGARQARVFLTPTLDDLHDPHLLLGIDAAVARIQQAVAHSEPILIYGDYDVDGTTATVLLKTAIERIAPPGNPAQVAYHVPHRLREGYGIQNSRLAEAAAAGVRLVISVDTGIRAFAAATEARELGLDLIVTDHHLPDGVEGLPDALAVINPAQPGCPYPEKHLCGAAVAFKLAHALLLAQARTPEQQIRLREKLLPSFLKLVAIATIADSVPLAGENRTLALLGLRELANPIQPGLRALMQVAEIPLDRSPTAAEVGFRLAPRINAAGRMDIASDVVELFLTRDPARANALAAKLNSLNEARRATEAAALEAIEIQLLSLLTAAGNHLPECLVLDHPEWHRGVLGILASRVVERTGRPALVLTTGDDEAHGSGRSVPGFHLLDALTAVNAVETHTPLFSRFGGHAHAVGFSLPAASLPALRERMRAHSAPLLTGEILHPPQTFDLELPPGALTPELFAAVARFAPFGIGNPEPVFLIPGLILGDPPRTIPSRTGQARHICLSLTQTVGGRPLSALGWSRGSQSRTQPPWPERIAGLERGSVVDLICRLRENKHPQFGGPELELLDLRF